jgi:DNA-binding transcriptional regulator YiaG
VLAERRVSCHAPSRLTERARVRTFGAHRSRRRMLLNRKKRDALDAPMSPTELAEARATLAMTSRDFADLVDVTVFELERFESGATKVPPMVAMAARMHVAERRQRDAMAASGLPPCPEAERLVEAADLAFGVLNEAEDATGQDDAADRVRVASDALNAHMRGCAVCTARREYMASHAPPMPELDVTPGVFGRLLGAGERLSVLLRVPTDSRGTGRRMGLWLSMLALTCGVVPLAIITATWIARGRVREVPMQLLGVLAFAVAYVATGFACGWVWDALRPLRGRFAGYLLRGALVPATAFACIGLTLLLTRDGSVDAMVVLPAIMGVLGALGGAILWLWHRIRGKLPRQAAH